MRYDLAAPEHDVDRPAGRSPVRRSYILCSNPRSGSSLLAEALHATGRLGTPIEYFDRGGAMDDLLERWRPSDLAGYIAELQRRRTTPEGLLGAKLHWYQLLWLAAALDPVAVPGPYGRERAALDVIFPACRYVRVRRADRDRQAVSWAIAEATGRWGDFGTDDRPPSVPYDYDAIDPCRRRIDESEAGWTDLLAAAGVEPLVIRYEDLQHRYAITVARVAAFLGVSVEPGSVAPPRLRRQADAHSEWLLRRYRQDRARHGRPEAIP